MTKKTEEISSHNILNKNFRSIKRLCAISSFFKMLNPYKTNKPDKPTVIRTCEMGSFKANCLIIASSIANSPLVKTAIAAEDANWGRIIMAIGKTNLKVNLKKLKISFGSHLITSNGQRVFDYNEKVISEYMKNDEIKILVDFGENQNGVTVWTCDLTHKYIDINGNYRS